MKRINRRSFLKNAGMVVGASVVVPTIIPACVRGKRTGNIAPSDKINMTLIGAGNQGYNDTKGFLGDDRVQITGICDVNTESVGYWAGTVRGRNYMMRYVDKAYSEKYGKDYKGCKGYEDFREVLLNKDIDVVSVATPDHWHAIPSLMAADAGKDIYCQKPLALTIQEGRDIANAVKKNDVIFQTGSQRRSERGVKKICEIVRNGRIGDLHTIHIGLGKGTPDFGKTAHLTDTDPVPKGFDYDTWLGTSPEAPYCPARTHVNFRWVLDYAGGQVTDWGGHFFDVAQLGMGTDDTGPVKIQKAKARWSDHKIYNTAVEYYFEVIYANGVKIIASSDLKHGFKFEGTEGSVGSYGNDPENIMDTVIGSNEIHLYDGKDSNHRNFIDCVISREPNAAPAEIGHRSATIAHLGNIALRLEQDLEWDPVNEKILNSEVANEMLSRPMREPWASIYKKYVV